jgi:hypothetical protein
MLGEFCNGRAVLPNNVNERFLKRGRVKVAVSEKALFGVYIKIHKKGDDEAESRFNRTHIIM